MIAPKLDPSRRQVVAVGDAILPEALKHVADAIDQSRRLLDLEDDWDDDGTPGYADATWNRAVTFLAQTASRLWEQHGVQPDTVEVLPGAHGGIGLDWRSPGHELLVTVPADPAQDAPYYGDDGAGGRKIKGTLDTSAPNPWLLAWLAE